MFEGYLKTTGVNLVSQSAKKHREDEEESKIAAKQNAKRGKKYFFSLILSRIFPQNFHPSHKIKIG